MQDEFDALQHNRTWQLVPPPRNVNIISGKWVFRHKHRPDGTLERYKARWVVSGFRQRAGVDFTDTFAPIVKSGMIRTVLQLAVSRVWTVHQLEVSNAFLHGHLAEQVYCQQPIGFVDAAHPDHVCLLSRSLYGLKKAPRAWYQRIIAFLHQLGFQATRFDASLFVFSHSTALAYLLLYVDDIIFTASSAKLLAQLTAHLSAEFALKDLGALHYFLGIEVIQRSDDFFLHQQKYAHELLERAGMLNCKTVATPVDMKAKLSTLGVSPAPNVSLYRPIVGALPYLTLTKPYIQYAVQQVCLHMHVPCDNHWNLVKRILRYICGTMSLGLTLRASSSTELVAYSDTTGQAAPTLNALHPATAFTSGLPSFPGRQNDNQRCPDPVPRTSTGRWPTSSPNAPGCTNFFKSFITTPHELHLCTLITSPPSISPPTPFIIEIGRAHV